MLVKKHNLLFISFAILATLLGSSAILYLPERFMYDALTISLDRYNEKGWLGSYPVSMMLYHVTGVGKLPFPLVAIIQLPIIFFILFRLQVPKIFYHFTLRNVILWLGLLMYGIYVGFPSKEFITALYIWLICLVLISKTSLNLKILYSLILFVFFGWFYRQYFILVPFLALGLYVLSYVKFKNKLLSVMTSGVMLACFMSLSYGLIKGEFMSEGSREQLNRERLKQGDQDAATMIISPIKTDSFHGETLGIVYGFFTVNLPVTGLRFLFKPHVIAFVIWQLSLFIYLLYFYNKVLNSKAKYNHELWIFHLLFAYFIIQGVFEPDLGSAVKHKLGVFPLIWLALFYDQGLIKRPKINKKYVFRNTK